jgi:hypothetical protein
MKPCENEWCYGRGHDHDSAGNCIPQGDRHYDRARQWGHPLRALGPFECLILIVTILCGVFFLVNIMIWVLS